VYDDGDRWTGDAMHIYLLNAAPPPPQPALATSDVFSVAVPPGASGGQTIQVAGPGGQPFSVQVPHGLHAGQTFQFRLPSAPVATAVPLSHAEPPVVYGQPVATQPVEAKAVAVPNA